MTLVESAQPLERDAPRHADVQAPLPASATDVAVSAFEPATSTGTPPQDGTRLIAFWLLAAVAVTVSSHLSVLRGPFTEKHAWVSAHFAMMAHAFRDQGVLGLGAVPMQNYPPAGSDPDAYIHWPPLFPVVLSVVYRVFGETEAAARGFMLAILLANVLAIQALAAACRDRRAGLFAAFALLTIPAVDVYGRLVLHLHLAILFLLLGVLAFVKAAGGDRERVDRRWAAFGLGSMALAMLTSWEPILACAGLFGVAWWTRRRVQIRLALAYGAVCAAVVAGVIGLYCLSLPRLTADLWHTALFRSGLRSYAAKEFTLHTIVNDREYALSNDRISAPAAVILFAMRFWLIGGQLAALALAWLIAYGWVSRRLRGDGRLAIAFSALLSAWLLWFALMRNHACVHEYEMMLAAPAAAFAIGVCGVALVDLVRSLAPSNARRAGLSLLAAAPAVLLFPHVLNAKLAWQAPAEDRAEALVAFAERVRQATRPGDIVLVASNSMVPVYYSQRHTIRGVTDEALGRIEDRLPATFPGSKAYLALMGPEELTAFPDAGRRYARRVEEGGLVLLEVPSGESGISPERALGNQDPAVRGGKPAQTAAGSHQNPPGRRAQDR